MTSIPWRKSLTWHIGVERKRQLQAFLTVLFITDVVMLSLAFLMAYWIRFEFDLPFAETDIGTQGTHILIAAILLPVWLLLFAFSELYNAHYLFGSTQEYKKVFTACSIAFTLVVVVTFLVPIVRVSRGWIVIAWSLAIGLVSIGRFILRRIASMLRAHGWMTSRTLIIGTDAEGQAIAQQLASMPCCGNRIVGFIDDEKTFGTVIQDGKRVVGRLNDLPTLVKIFGVDELIISTSAIPRDAILKIFQTFAHSDEVELRFSPGLFEIYTSGMRVKNIGNVHLVSMRKVRLDGIETAIKAIMDYTVAFWALVLASPIFMIIGLAIKLDSPGPIFYRRRVVGGQAHEFDAFKFRTMYVNGDQLLVGHPELQAELEANQKIKDDPRVTRLGQFLRKYSIDEIPQLFNILLGQMSLVGPRMITAPEVEKYGKWYLNLWTVKPGLTGLWQVSGRSDVSYAERVRLDMYYIRNYTVWFDLQILLHTLPAVLSRRGAY
jgi:exopolysaccharide biosynthesis polyprenyl glycosylphosphotransferase